MIPLLLVPAQVQAAPALPPVYAVPQGLRIKPGSLEVRSFDQESFEIQRTIEQAPVRLNVRGRTWRFILESSGARAGILSLLQRFKPALEAGGWAWQWEQRNVARLDRDGEEYWIKAAPSGGGVLQVTLIQKGQARTLTLARPGQVPEVPAPDTDFPYLTPWPGGTLVVSTPSQPGPPVIADLGDGQPRFVGVTYIEKEYDLPDPPSPFEFVTSYRQALEAAGWEIEGDHFGDIVQVQAIYLKDGRDIRLVLRLFGKSMAVAVADVGAQYPKKKP